MATTVNERTQKMKSTLLYIAVAAVAVLGVAFLASAQQMDGRNCDWAYKKLQQHRSYGVCQEQGDHNRAKDTAEPTGDGEHTIRDKVESGVRDFLDRF